MVRYNNKKFEALGFKRLDKRNFRDEVVYSFNNLYITIARINKKYVIFIDPSNFYSGRIINQSKYFKIFYYGFDVGYDFSNFNYEEFRDLALKMDEDAKKAIKAVKWTEWKERQFRKQLKVEIENSKKLLEKASKMGITNSHILSDIEWLKASLEKNNFRKMTECCKRSMYYDFKHHHFNPNGFYFITAADYVNHELNELEDAV